MLIINTGDKNTIAIQISYLKVIAILRILPITPAASNSLVNINHEDVDETNTIIIDTNTI